MLPIMKDAHRGAHLRCLPSSSRRSPWIPAGPPTGQPLLRCTTTRSGHGRGRDLQPTAPDPRFGLDAAVPGEQGVPATAALPNTPLPRRRRRPAPAGRRAAAPSTQRDTEARVSLPASHQPCEGKKSTPPPPAAVALPGGSEGGDKVRPASG